MMVLRIAAVAAIASAAPAAAQYQCTAPTSNSWLRQAPASTPETRIDDRFVRPVTRALPHAVAMLKKQALIRLSERDVKRFTGTVIPSDQSLRPYLVRAVFPTATPNLELSWGGSSLHVFAAGLGCAPFTKHPIVVFLDRKPHRVFVMASAAL